jgi:hypothetical protein
MKIIDFEKKGNVVRFYLGEKTEEWGWTNSEYKDYTGKMPDWLKPSDEYYGDDWNDMPYEHNAGTVYGEFIKGYKDIAFDFDDLVLERCDGEFNSPWCKEDMTARRVPCIIVVPKAMTEGEWSTDFKYWVATENVKKYYFGDELE